MRKRLWQLHSWLGLVAGLGLLVVGLTGSILVFQEELTALCSPAAVVVAPAAAGRLPLDTLLARAQRQLPDHEITGWHVRTGRPALADNLYLIRRGDNVWLTGTLDPYTGRLLSAPRHGDTTLHGWLLNLHYKLFAGEIGELLTGLFAVLLCTLGVTGVWLYREFWRHVFTLRWRRGARLLFSDLHKFVGITSVAFNLGLGFTGAYWNLSHLAGHLGGHEVAQPVIGRRLYADTLSLDAIVRDAAARLPGFRANFISLPSDPAAPAVILWGAVEPRPLLASLYGSLIFYDPQTGGHRRTMDLRTAGGWRRFTDTFKPVHFGNFGGLPVKILWSLAGLAPGLLALTGFSIWLVRRRAGPDQLPATARPAAPVTFSS